MSQRSPMITTTSESPAPPLPGSAPSTPKIIYKTELYVPIKRDVESFEERQRRLFESVDSRATRRIRRWDQEMERMRSDFFRLQPFDESGYRIQSVEDLMDGRRRLSDVFYDSSTGSQGSKRFCVSFDVGEFQPEEIKVTTENRRIKVHAKNDQKIGDSRTISREFSREVDIPAHVDDKSLQCTLSNDGILQIEAAVPVPAYNKIRNSVTSDILEDSSYQLTPLESSVLCGGAPGAGLNNSGRHGSTRGSTSSSTTTTTSSSSSRLVKTISGGGPGGTTTTRTVTTTSTGGVPVGGANDAVGVANESILGGGGVAGVNTVGITNVGVTGVGEREFKVVVDDIAGDYGADEIGVRVRRTAGGHKLLVTARHESQQPGRRCFREFCREFEMPSGVRIAGLTATLDAGQLVLKAPYYAQAQDAQASTAAGEELNIPVITRA